MTNKKQSNTEIKSKEIVEIKDVQKIKEVEEIKGKITRKVKCEIILITSKYMIVQHPNFVNYSVNGDFRNKYKIGDFYEM